MNPPANVDPERMALARRALDWPRPTLDDIAEEIGATRSALNGYRAGQRPLPPPVAHALASWLRRRAAESLDLAAELDRLT